MNNKHNIVTGKYVTSKKAENQCWAAVTPMSLKRGGRRKRKLRRDEEEDEEEEEDEKII